jgi:hypothetical protein
MPLEYRSPSPPQRPLSRADRALRGVALALLVFGLAVGLLGTIEIVLGLLAIWPFSDYRDLSLDGRVLRLLPILVIAITSYTLAIIGSRLDPTWGRGRADEEDR